MSNKSEKKLTEDCRCSEAASGSVLFRNAVGFMNGFSFGLSPGSSDEIGWKEKIITPDMVGQKVAIFQAIEIKTLTDKISYEQIIFYLNVRYAGGLAQVYTEDRFLTHEEIMNFPRRKEKLVDKIQYEKIISNLSKKLSL